MSGVISFKGCEITKSEIKISSENWRRKVWHLVCLNNPATNKLLKKLGRCEVTVGSEAQDASPSFTVEFRFGPADPSTPTSNNLSLEAHLKSYSGDYPQYIKFVVQVAHVNYPNMKSNKVFTSAPILLDALVGSSCTIIQKFIRGPNDDVLSSSVSNSDEDSKLLNDLDFQILEQGVAEKCENSQEENVEDEEFWWDVRGESNLYLGFVIKPILVNSTYTPTTAQQGV